MTHPTTDPATGSSTAPATGSSTAPATVPVPGAAAAGQILCEDYRPGTVLDTELAALGYAAVRGWPDQRPITPALVRSRLRPHDSHVPTVLATRRAPGGRLIAAAALRWPGPGGSGRLWGPVVHPDHQQRGLGRALLETLTALHAPTTWTRPTTAEIPAGRQRACRFFELGGWASAPDLLLLKRPLPLPDTTLDDADVPEVTIRPASVGEHLDAPLAELFHAVFPRLGVPVAAATYSRWIADERYRPAHLLLAEHRDRFVGAALVYTLAHTHPTEPAEALLADLLIAPTSVECRPLADQLTTAALAAAHADGARVARAVVPGPDVNPVLAACLFRLGFTTTARMRVYRPVT